MHRGIQWSAMAPWGAASRVAMCALALLGAAAMVVAPAGAQEAGSQPLRLLGEYVLPADTTFEGTTVGGLSGVTYDRARGLYYAISDDRGEMNPPRFYTLRIGVGLDGFQSVDVVGVTSLDSDANTPGVQPYDRNDSDTEDIALLPDDTLIISSERDRDNNPWIRRFDLDGNLLGDLPLADRFLPAFEKDAAGRDMQVRGVRNNLAFEGLALTPTGDTLYTANEQALAQDGPMSTQQAGTNVRLLRYAMGPGGRAHETGEWVYRTEPIFANPTPANGSADNGVSGMTWINHVLPGYDLLFMERSFVTGVGNNVNLFGVRIDGAQNVQSLTSLPTPFAGQMVSKTLLANVAASGAVPDNIEGITLGPTLPNGKPSLLLVVDNNFSDTQVQQMLLYEVSAAVAGK